jgi:hypothetical protein
MPITSNMDSYEATRNGQMRYPVENGDTHRPDPPNSGLKRRLLREGAAERIREGLRLSGNSAAIDAFLIERCSIEAEAVLRGNLAAANRLWLLLQTSIESGSPLPASILGDGAQDVLRRTPTVIDGGVLLRLVAGVTRAANQPSEAEVMLQAVGRLLQPLFQLDLAAAAIERARQGHSEMLDTLVIAQVTPRSLEALSSASDPIPIRDQVIVVPSGNVTLDPNRVPFDSTSWLQLPARSTIDNWGALWPCIGGVHKSMSEIDRFGPRYHIDSISPVDVCVGQTLTIQGANFGPAGRVTFPAPTAKDPIFALGIDEDVLLGVTPTLWTNSRIEVVVPRWATAGNLHLSAFTTHRDPCTTIDVYRLGNTAFFKGGLASVYQVSLDGVDVDLSNPDGLSLPLGQTITLSWHTSGGPGTLVRMKVAIGDRVLVDRSNLPGGFGTLAFSIPITDPEKPMLGSLTFLASGPCGQAEPLNIPVWLSVPPRLTIEYVEVTQGVQTDLADVLVGRGMPTVANKDTAVRVHMQCNRGGWFSNQLANISGALFVDGRRLPPTNVANIKGFSNANVTNDTLNFSIPAAWLTKGEHTLSAKVLCNDRSGKIEVQQIFKWTWFAKDPFRVRAIYMDAGGSALEMLDYARKALDFLPTDLTNIGIASRHSYANSNQFRDTDDWHDLVLELEDAWDDADEESGTRWLGIVPASRIPPNATIAGISSGAPSIAVLARSDAPQTGAHELGHSLGLNHVDFPPAGFPGGFPEPAQPYDSLDNSGLLRRPTFDVRTNQAVALPAPDLMSYFRPRGVGITNWMTLFNGFGDR